MMTPKLNGYIMSREEAEKLIMGIVASHAGEKMAPNLFKDSVDQLLRDVNGASTFEEVKKLKTGVIEGEVNID